MFYSQLVKNYHFETSFTVAEVIHIVFGPLVVWKEIKYVCQTQSVASWPRGRDAKRGKCPPNFGLWKV